MKAQLKTVPTFGSGGMWGYVHASVRTGGHVFEYLLRPEPCNRHEMLTNKHKKQNSS